jgi:hypothetical protein
VTGGRGCPTRGSWSASRTRSAGGRRGSGFSCCTSRTSSASFRFPPPLSYKVDTPRPSPRTNRTRLCGSLPARRLRPPRCGGFWAENDRCRGPCRSVRSPCLLASVAAHCGFPRAIRLSLHVSGERRDGGGAARDVCEAPRLSRPASAPGRACPGSAGPTGAAPHDPRPGGHMKSLCLKPPPSY